MIMKHVKKKSTSSLQFNYCNFIFQTKEHRESICSRNQQKVNLLTKYRRVDEMVCLLSQPFQNATICPTGTAFLNKNYEVMKRQIPKQRIRNYEV